MKKTHSLLLILIGIILIAASNKDITDLSARDIQKSMAEISDRLYAGKWEVSNLEYNCFLNDLIAKNEMEKYNTSFIDSSGWTRINLSFKSVAKHYHSNKIYNNYPVVNISYNGAVNFCEWLTDKYNIDNKRKFKKVEFRLPTENEWITAAEGGKENAQFPWGGAYKKNSKCWPLCNYRQIDQTYIKKDSSGKEFIIDFTSSLNAESPSSPKTRYLISSIRSYYPNAFGLFNMSGNVAEMLTEKGRTKGGCWNSTGYYVQIQAEDEFAGFEKPSPFIGFRYFMEVVEY